MIKAAILDVEIDLLPLSRNLKQRGIDHQINEESGKQVVWVRFESHLDYVRTAIEHFQAGDFAGPEHLSDSSALPDSKLIWRQLYSNGKKFFAVFLQAPVTMTLITVCCLVALVSQMGAVTSSVRFLFYPVIANDGVGSLLASINSVELFLRTLGPMFLHFGVLHLVFNMLWLWYFGRQLENHYPSWWFLIVVVFTSFAANATQYLASGFNNFGGMSGVVYGLVAYTWILHSLLPHSRLMLNHSMFVFFIAALVLMEVLASSWIATAAHLGGLIAGLIIGLTVVAYLRIKNSAY